MNFSIWVDFLVEQIWSFPVLIFIFSAAIYTSVQLNFVQFRYVIDSIKMLLAPCKHSDEVAKSGELTPFQAFLNTLGANIGNGSLAGVAVTLHTGGPGAIVWVMILCMFSVVFRYAEVFLATYVIGKYKFGNATGGPMVYMSMLPGGNVLAYVITLFVLGYMFVGGNLAQCHALGLVVYKSSGVSEYITAWFVLVFIGYIILGGLPRIVYSLDKFVPFKVFAFLATAIILLFYHIKSVPNALYIMTKLAFQPQAFIGGGLGFALQHVMSIGFQQGVYASESGLATAAVAFGSTKKDPVENGILAMLGVFINIHVVCFLVALSLIASGVWNNGETSSALIVSAYETVFGKYAGLIVSILVVNFTMSVLVASAYNGKKCWEFLFNGKYLHLYSILFALFAFCGTWLHVDLVWSLNNFVNGLLLLINILGILYFTSIMKKELKIYGAKHG